MLKKIGIAVALVLVVFVLLVATRPGHFKIERSTVVAASPAVVHSQVNSFANWKAWSPWEGMDPNMARTYEGAESGVGAKYAWKGNDQVGEGRMTIVESVPGAKIAIQLEFLKPMEATNETVFTFAPQGDGTLVTWAMSGENDFVGKAFSMFIDMDKMVGGDFEKGLASLKKASEQEQQEREAAVAAAAAAATSPTAVTAP